MPASWMPDRDELLHIRKVEGAWRVGLRAGISVLVPQMFLLWIGRPELAPYASFGAFASLYVRQLAYFTRLQMQVSAGITLTMAVVTGVLVGLVPDAPWLQIGMAAVIAATGQVFARAHRYHPPGPLFMIFAYGAISSMPHVLADISRGLVTSLASATFAVLVGVSGLSLKPGGIRREWAETGLLRLDFVHDWKPAWLALAVVPSGTIAHLSGIGHPYWAMVAAIAPLTAPHVTTQVTRGAHRAVGTLLGLLPAWALLSLHLPPEAAVLVVAVLQVVTEMVVGANYAAAMLFITPMALLMGELGARHEVGPLLFDRGAETVIGCLVAFVLAVFGHTLRQRRLRRRNLSIS